MNRQLACQPDLTSSTMSNLLTEIVRAEARHDLESAPAVAKLHLRSEGRNKMSFRIAAIVTIISLSTCQTASTQSGKETSVQSQTMLRTRAKAKITVQSSEAKPYDRTASP